MCSFACTNTPTDPQNYTKCKVNLLLIDHGPINLITKTYLHGKKNVQFCAAKIPNLKTPNSKLHKCKKQKKKKF